jgi:hypothetical protein
MAALHRGFLPDGLLGLVERLFKPRAKAVASDR